MQHTCNIQLSELLVTPMEVRVTVVKICGLVGTGIVCALTVDNLIISYNVRCTSVNNGWTLLAAFFFCVYFLKRKSQASISLITISEGPIL